MKIKGSYSQILALSALLLAGLGCGSGKKPSSSLKSFQVATPPAQTPPAKAPAPAPVSAAATDPSAKAKVPSPSRADQKPAAPKVDRVADLVASAEKEYQAGNSEFAAGHNDAAKQHFDAAFNQLQGSPLELHSDDRFQREFDRVVEALNKLDTASQVEGQSEEKSEPAPIDEANEVNNYPVDPNLKAKRQRKLKPPTRISR